MVVSSAAERLIQCRHCGANNPVAQGVAGTICRTCGWGIYTPEFEAEIAAAPKPLKAVADHGGEELRVTCPWCGCLNDFAELNEKYGLVRFKLIERFSCYGCGKPIEVVERVREPS